MSNKLQEMTHDMQTRISELAYMMWESAGRQQGMAMEYWLKAEKEVMSTLQAAAHNMMPSQAKPAAAARPAATAAPSVPTPKPIAGAPPAVEAPKPAVAAQPGAASSPPATARKTAARGRSKS